MAVLCGVEIVKRHVQLLVSVAAEIVLVLGGIIVASVDDGARQLHSGVILALVFLFLGLYCNGRQLVILGFEADVYGHTRLFRQHDALLFVADARCNECVAQLGRKKRKISLIVAAASKSAAADSYRDVRKRLLCRGVQDASVDSCLRAILRRCNARDKAQC